MAWKAGEFPLRPPYLQAATAVRVTADGTGEVAAHLLHGDTAFVAIHRNSLLFSF